MLAILAAHGIPYAATASVAYVADLIEKVRKAKGIRGTRFLHILAPCPPGWKSSDEESIALARMAVQCRVFPLVEVEDGERWRLSRAVTPAEPVAPYLARQGRFRHLTEAQVARIQSDVDARWKALERRVAAS
jgi:pyruvate/2-oxoacid:ferredoxin oxidoreductase beta subunit